MQVKKTISKDTQVTLEISASEPELTQIKKNVLAALAKDLKIQGFRAGKAPINLVEKNLDASQLQTQFLDEAMSALYQKACQNEDIRPVTRPEVQIRKFVPFSTLDFEVKTEIINDIKLPNYKKLKAVKEVDDVTAKDVNDVVESLRTRIAEKIDVERASKDGDEVWIDFKGVDSKGQPIPGADGKDYPLVLGSKTFIPGFEENVIGLKPNDEKTFELTFPKDYGLAALAGKKVKFSVTLKKVQEVQKPELDDDFAKKAGPFTTLKDLKADIKKQIGIERENQAVKKQQGDIVKQIVDKTDIKLPETLVEQQITYNLDEIRRNLTYRGQTYQEFLDTQSTTEEKYRNDVLKPQAIEQVKTSLVLAEIAEAEKLSVSPEELEIRIQMLKGQYSDPTMQAELDKPENRQDIASRMLTEKVLQVLTKS